MSHFSITLEKVQDIDIKSGRLLGITQEPLYRELVEEYELDTAQCFLWLDVAHLLNYIMEEYDYNDVELEYEELGKVVRRILKQKRDRFVFLVELVEQNHLLDVPEELGTIIEEMIEDIYLVYRGIQADLEEIFTSQEEINDLIDTSLEGF